MDWIDAVNTQPHYNVATAIECGLETPEVLFLGNLTIQEREDIFINDEWEVVGNTGMAIQRLPGINATFHRYWDGENWSCDVVTIGDRGLLSGGQGLLLTSNCLTMFSGSTPKLDRNFDKLSKMINSKTEYRGFISIDITFRDNKIYYKNLQLGATWQFLFCLKKFFGCELETLFESRKNDKPQGYANSLRVHAYPYDIERNKVIVESIMVALPDMAWDGESYIVCSNGDKIITAWKNLYDRLAGLERFGLCYRVDGDKKARQTFHELKRCKHV